MCRSCRPKDWIGKTIFKELTIKLRVIRLATRIFRRLRETRLNHRWTESKPVKTSKV
jgi:hypothetical protein